MNDICIISSYNDMCGIASYTKSLINGFNDNGIQVSIIELNQEILHSNHKIDKKASIIHINNIKNEIAKYEYINIQMEFGLFGANFFDIYKRLFSIIKACKNKKLTITYHTIESHTMLDVIMESLSAIIRIKPKKLLRSMTKINSVLKANLLKRITRYVLKNGGSVIVHTKRDKRIIMNMYGKITENIYCHPLCFHTDTNDTGNSGALEIRKKLEIDPTKIIIGVFGFISEYKGFDVAIRTLCYLPENYILCIFGGQHPSSVCNEPKGSKFTKKLLQIVDHYKLENRVIFYGSIDNEDDFYQCIRISDHIILPYNEIGQSGSGVASLALSLNPNVYLSRTIAFKELANFFRNSFYFFDIGNYQELAQKIKMSRFSMNQGRSMALKEYNMNTNINLYKKSFGLD